MIKKLPADGIEPAGSRPTVVDRDRWQAQLDELLVREKAHTREGDAIAAARRRLPMVEVEPGRPRSGLAWPPGAPTTSPAGKSARPPVSI